jgi:4-hydroxy-tetrahydrodipicolinate reductase
VTVLRVLIIGAAGRMGQALTRAARERTDVQVTAGVESAHSAHIGHDIGEVAGAGALGAPIAADVSRALADCDAALDFSHASATAANLAACVAAGKPLLIGTTGLAPDVQHELDRAARHIPLLLAANTSLAVTLLVEMARQCARVLGPQFDVEILEAHHRHKRDAPSGTALALGHAVAEARSRQLEHVGVGSRAGTGPREEGQIGFAVVRGGDIVGEHSVLFAGSGEQLLLTHRATDRAVFARGALDAAVWLARCPPGRYSMRDFLEKQ